MILLSYCFDYDENRLNFDNIYYIPSKVQGVSFDENGKVILSTSYGRRQSSYLKIYRSADAMSKNIDKYIKKIEFLHGVIEFYGKQIIDIILKLKNIMMNPNKIFCIHTELLHKNIIKNKEV